jgi:RNA polymerase sigma-70 factor (ECF subfamily)
MLQLSREEMLGYQIVELLPQLRAFARRFERDPTKVEDLVQEVVSRALGNLDKFTVGTNLRSWLFTITRNTFCTQFALRKRETAGREDCVSGQAWVPPSQEWVLQMSDFIRALDELPSKYRRALELVLIEGKSYEWAAEVCECPTGTIKSRVNRAREQLSKRLM